MKYHIMCAAMVVLTSFPSIALAQDNASNAVKTTIMLDASGEKQLIHTDYYDGIGRLSQRVEGSNNSPLYTHTLYQYDYNGRLSTEWIPVYIHTLGAYSPMVQYTSASYSRNSNPTATTAYDCLDRVTGKQGPGAEFGNHGITCLYSTNSTNEIKTLQATDAGIKYTGNASAGSYEKELHTDADGKIYTVFKDLAGRVVLERRATSLNTYYVYDKYGQLRCVIPPALSSQFPSVGTLLSYSSEPVKKYAYLYTYDSKGRCVEKKLPGCAPQHFYYDKNDRLIFKDDGNLQDSGRMQFYLYDKLGRMVVRGTCKAYTGSISSIAVYATQRTNNNSSDTDGYVANISLEDVRLELTNTYDRYYNVSVLANLTAEERAIASFSADSRMESNPIANPQGKLVCTKTYQVDDCSKQTVSVFFYDEKGQLICTNSTNHMGGTDITYTDYTFTGNPAKVLHLSTSTGFSPVTETYSYSYDNRDRLSEEHYSINDGNPSIIQYSYDGFGRLSGKTVGGESISYDYNVRNWPTEIKSDKFKEYLYYASGNTNVSMAPATPCYNGNLSGARYKYGDNTLYGFDYTYDSLNRLTKSRYGDNPTMNSGRNNAFTEDFTYDNMGNVTSLMRNGKKDDGTYGLIDDLTFSYNGNQLEYVDNAGPGAHYTGSSSYQDNDDATDEYEYDKNGNLVKNSDKNISMITYNVLNLPSKVTTGTGDGYGITYTYDAQGRKLRAYYRRMWMDVITLRKQQVKSLMTDSRIGGIVSPIRPDTLISMDSIFPAPFPLKQLSLDVRYNGNLMFSGNRITVFNPHGYSTITTNQTTGEITTDRYYYLKDHLGSNRVVFREGGEVVQQNHYYAFGGLTAESTGGTLQSFKFNGKEFDRMLGLDLYDYGARWYDPVGSLGFTTMDPLAEEDYGVSPYVYCRNNPVRYIDKDGNKPGDPYISADAAALNFGLIYNYWSIKNNAEYTGVIYQYEKDNVKYYSYMVSGPQGEAYSNYEKMDASSIPRGISPKVVATIHTHGADDSNTEHPHYGNTFSKQDYTADKANYKNSNGDIVAGYLCTTNGTLKKHLYDKDTGRWQIITFHGESNCLPSDANDITHNKYTTDIIDDKKNNLFNIFTNMDTFLEDRKYAW